MANVSSSKVKCICGEPVKEGASFCPNCGIKYYRDDEDIKCPNCGKKILAGDNYCQHCGKPNRSIETQNSAYEEFIDNASAKSNVTIRSYSKNDKVLKNKTVNNKSNNGEAITIIGELILILAGIIAFSAICLALIDTTGEGKLPIIGWIFVGITYLVFGGDVQGALTVAVVLGVIGGICFLVGKSKQ